MRAVLYCALFLFFSAACASVNAAPNETPAEPLVNGAANFYYPSHAQIRVVLNPQNPHLKDIRVRRAIVEVLGSFPRFQSLLGGEFKPVDSLFNSTPFAFSKELETPRSLAAIKPLLGDIEFLPLREGMIGGDLPGIPSFEMERIRLRAAIAMLELAGFERRDNRFIKTGPAASGTEQKSGAQFELEILYSTECAEAYWAKDSCRRAEIVAIEFAEQLKRIGIPAPLRLLSSAQLAARKADGSFSVFVEYTEPHFTRKDLFDAASNTENYAGAGLGDARPDAILWRHALAGTPQAAMSKLAVALTDANDFVALQDVTHAFDILARYNRTVIPIRSWKRVDEYVNQRLDGIREALSRPAAVSNTFEDGKVAYDRKDYAEALRIWQLLAEQGNAQAQSNLGGLYVLGLGAAKDSKQAAAWYRRAADQGQVDAQYSLGHMYAFGVGVPQDDAQAVALFRRAAEQGHAQAQSNLAEMYSMGSGVAKDEALAADWMRRAAEQGFARAQFNLGLMYFKGEGVTKDEAQAAAWYRRAADQGLEFAQFNLGLMYANGWGVAKDEAQAASWYRRAADQGSEKAKAELAKLEAIVDSRTKFYRKAAEGDQGAITALHFDAQMGEVEAQFSLGALYADGKFVTKDGSEAEKWFRKAAEQGHEKAKDALAKLAPLPPKAAANAASFNDGVDAYLRGDHKEAVRIWQPIAEQGDADAQSRLADMYREGKGVPKDAIRAAALYQLAAEQGYPDGEYWFADMLEKGEGVARDNVRATELFRRVASGDSAYSSLTKVQLCTGYLSLGTPISPQEAADYCYLSLLGSMPVSESASDTLTLIAPFRGSVEFRRAVQALLKRDGYYSGPIDGSFGPGTIRAIGAAFNSKPSK
jgi:uncharacterized protein